MPDAPMLTDVQRLTLQNRWLAYQLAHTQLQAAVQALTVPGYVIDLERIVYVPTPAAPASAAAQGD